MIGRQGDVLLIREEIPTDARMEGEHTLVVRGETGNVHRMKLVNVYASGSTRFVEVTKPTELKHNQHPTLIIPPGSYRVARVRDRDAVDSLFVPAQTPGAAMTTPLD
jgi:hypothetical protein